MKASPFEFMPLCAAAALAYGSTLEEARCASEQELDERLNVLAAALSTAIPIFILAGPAAVPEVVRDNELARGAFRGGAYSFEFVDGTTPLANLVVRKTDLLTVVPRLRG